MGACLGHGDQHCCELKGTHIHYNWRFPSLQVDAARACFGASTLSLQLAVCGPACADLYNAGHSQWLRSWSLLPSFQRQGKTSPVFEQLQKTRLCWMSCAPHPGTTSPISYVALSGAPAPHPCCTCAGQCVEYHWLTRLSPLPSFHPPPRPVLPSAPSLLRFCFGPLNGSPAAP